MPTIRTIFALIICLSPQLAGAQQTPTVDPAAAPPQAPAPVAVPEQSASERHLDYATVQLREMKQIAAQIDIKVDMLDQKFTLDGNYYKDSNNRVRLQLNLNGLGDTNSKMLQVCDGKVLWDFQQVLNMQSYRKREIIPILDKLKDPNLDDNFRIMINSNMGFGGPEAMLSGLRKTIGFDQMGVDKVDGIDVIVLRGTWRDRTNLLGPNERALSPTASLPPYIPANVAVFIDSKGWPHKIEMIGKAPLLMEGVRQLDPVTNRPIGRPISPPKVEPTHITLRYKQLPLTDITPGLFKFEAPANVAATSVKDDTEEFLANLDQYIQFEVARKKAEASKGEGEPILKAKPLDVPTPPGEGLGTIPGAEGSQARP